MNRHEVKEVKCMNCDTIQPSQQNCKQCGIEFAGYFCSVCNLFDNDWQKKQIYHCEKCGICRVGGNENFFHCDNCQCCLSIAMKDNHQCIMGKLKQDCPVCMEDLHTSTKSSIFMRCGHVMHRQCFNGLVKNDQIACPLCKKSIIDPKEFEAHMDLQIALTPMP